MDFGELPGDLAKTLDQPSGGTRRCAQASQGGRSGRRHRRFVHRSRRSPAGMTGQERRRSRSPRGRRGSRRVALGSHGGRGAGPIGRPRGVEALRRDGYSGSSTFCPASRRSPAGGPTTRPGAVHRSAPISDPPLRRLWPLGGVDDPSDARRGSPTWPPAHGDLDRRLTSGHLTWPRAHGDLDQWLTSGASELGSAGGGGRRSVGRHAPWLAGGGPRPAARHAVERVGDKGWISVNSLGISRKPLTNLRVAREGAPKPVRAAGAAGGTGGSSTGVADHRQE